MDVPFQKCSRCLKNGEIQCPLCNFAFYCSQECLNKDKNRHSVQCKHAQRVQQCGYCKQQKSKLKYCSQCFYVFYCDSVCQKKDWVKHKDTCKKISNLISGCTVPEVYAPKSVFSIYLGVTVSQDYLNLNNNEGVDYPCDLSILMAGAGDIKNVVKTVTALPKKFERKISFVLNDLSTHAVARNILFLYLAIADPNPEHMVQVWYSLHLTSSCFSYLKRNLVRLATKPLETILADMKGLVKLSEEHWNKCLKVWRGWQRLANMDDLPTKMRNVFLIYRKNVLTAGNFSANISLAEAEKDLLENGLLLPPKSDLRSQAKHPNISLFCFNPFKSKDFQELAYVELDYLENVFGPDSGEMIYGGGRLIFGFPSWPWTEVQKENKKARSVLVAYESFIRKQFLEFSARVRKGLISFHFIIDSFKHVRYYLEQGTSFDRISVGHLGDVYLYPTLLQEFSDLLNLQNPCAVLLSHHSYWVLDLIQSLREGLMDLDKAKVFEAAHQLETEDNFKLPSALQNYRQSLARSNYFDIWPFFFRYLQKQAFAYNVKEIHENKIVHPGQIAKKFNLRLRNFHCEQNKVIQCQISEENRMRWEFPKTISLEWILDSNSKKFQN